MEITDAEFVARYKPRPNHLHPDQGFDYGAGCCLFETFGTDADFVRTQPTENIWTVLDCDGALIVANGVHFVNRFGYIITENPHNPDDTIEVVDDDEY